MSAIWYMIGIIIIALAMFLVGLMIGGDLERKRFDSLYPKLGRLGIIDDSHYRIDFTVDLSELSGYHGARLYISKVTKYEERHLDVHDDAGVEEMLDELEEAKRMQEELARE